MLFVPRQTKPKAFSIGVHTSHSPALFPYWNRIIHCLWLSTRDWAAKIFETHIGRDWFLGSVYHNWPSHPKPKVSSFWVRTWPGPVSAYDWSNTQNTEGSWCKVVSSTVSEGPLKSGSVGSLQSVFIVLQSVSVDEGRVLSLSLSLSNHLLSMRRG